jgi:membrane associated rhomboid family serine protease
MNRDRFPEAPQGPGIGIWRLTPAIKWIMIANLAVYIIELLTYHWLKTDAMIFHLSLTPARIYPGLEIWQPVTYMWMHDPTSPGHIILNMFGLWMFGTILEDRWGAVGFMKFYIASGFFAGLCVFLVGHILGKADTITLGASGAIYAVIIAFGMLFPNLRVYFLGLLPIKAKWIVYATIGGTLLYWLARTPGISISAHAGGMVAGALLISGWWNPRKAYRGIRALVLRRKLRVLEKNFERKKDDEDHPVYH